MNLLEAPLSLGKIFWILVILCVIGNLVYIFFRAPTAPAREKRRYVGIAGCFIFGVLIFSLGPGFVAQYFLLTDSRSVEATVTESHPYRPRGGELHLGFTYEYAVEDRKFSGQASVPARYPSQTTVAFGSLPIFYSVSHPEVSAAIPPSKKAFLIRLLLFLSLAIFSAVFVGLAINPEANWLKALKT